MKIDFSRLSLLGVVCVIIMLHYSCVIDAADGVNEKIGYLTDAVRSLGLQVDAMGKHIRDAKQDNRLLKWSGLCLKGVTVGVLVYALYTRRPLSQQDLHGRIGPALCKHGDEIDQKMLAEHQGALNKMAAGHAERMEEMGDDLSILGSNIKGGLVDLAKRVMLNEDTIRKFGQQERGALQQTREAFDVSQKIVLDGLLGLEQEVQIFEEHCDGQDLFFEKVLEQAESDFNGMVAKEGQRRTQRQARNFEELAELVRAQSTANLILASVNGLADVQGVFGQQIKQASQVATEATIKLRGIGASLERTRVILGGPRVGLSVQNYVDMAREQQLLVKHQAQEQDGVHKQNKVKKRRRRNILTAIEV